MSKTLSWAAADAAPRPFSATVLYVAAAALRAASDLLARHAARVAAAEAQRTVTVHAMEFHAIYRDAGAPEGAIYVNGELVGVIEGVTRL